MGGAACNNVGLPRKCGQRAFQLKYFFVILGKQLMKCLNIFHCQWRNEKNIRG